MKRHLFLASAIALASTNVVAADVPTASSQFSATATLASDYIFKGMTQSWGQPALQGSLDYSHSSGISASIWASTVSSKVYAGADSEIDFSAGYKNAINPDWNCGVGLLSVVYPGGNYNKVKYAALPSQKYDFTEANVSVGYKFATIKYSQALTDLLGFNENTGYTGSSKGSAYLDISADIPLDASFVLNLHAGHQNVKPNLITPTAGGSTNPDFNDYRVALTRNFADGWSGSLALTWNSNTAFFNSTPSNNNLSETMDVGKKCLVLAASKTF